MYRSFYTCFPPLVAFIGFMLFGFAGYSQYRDSSYNERIEEMTRKQSEAKELIRAEAEKMKGNPLAGLMLFGATFGGSPELGELYSQQSFYNTRKFQFLGVGIGLFGAGAVWWWFQAYRRRHAAVAAGRAIVVAYFLWATVVYALLVAHLLLNDHIDMETALPFFAGVCVPPLICKSFAGAVSRGKISVALRLLLLGAAADAAALVALYQQCTDFVGLFLGYSKTTAEENWYLVMLGIQWIVGLVVFASAAATTPIERAPAVA